MPTMLQCLHWMNNTELGNKITCEVGMNRGSLSRQKWHSLMPQGGAALPKVFGGLLQPPPKKRGQSYYGYYGGGLQYISKDSLRKWMPEICCRLPKIKGIRIRRSSPGQALLLPQLNAVDLENLMTVAASKLGSLAIIVDDHQTDTFFFVFWGGAAGPIVSSR